MRRSDREAGRIVGSPEAVTSSLGGFAPVRTTGTATGENDWVWDHSYWIKPWLRQWNQRIPLTIAASKVEDDLEDLPVRFTENDLPSDFWDSLNFDDGRELRFTSADGCTMFPHDVEAIDTAGQTMDVWAAPPDLYDLTDTVVYLYYDSPGAVAPPAAWAQAVWVEYVAVWHLNEASGVLVDATGNGHDLANDGAEYGATGRIADALTFVSANTDSLARDSALVSDHPFSLECWFKTPDDASTGVLMYLGDKDAPDVYWIVYVSSTGQVVARSRNTADGIQAVSAADFDDDAWHHAAGVFGSDTLRKIYVDGNLEDTETTSVSVSGIDRVGVAALLDSTPGAYNEGEIDEVRIAAQAFSDEWWETSVNAASPATFYSVGAVEAEPDGDVMDGGVWFWDHSWWDGPDEFEIEPRVPPVKPFLWDYSNWDGPDVFD